MPVPRRPPSSGFASLPRALYAEVRLSELQNMKISDIDLGTLKAAGIVPRDVVDAKVILSGKLSRKVMLKGIKVTKGARAAIEAAGGKVEDMPQPAPKADKE